MKKNGIIILVGMLTVGVLFSSCKKPLNIVLITHLETCAGWRPVSLHATEAGVAPFTRYFPLWEPCRSQEVPVRARIE